MASTGGRDECNRIELSGRLIGRDALRRTPAGLALLNGRLAHESMQAEAGGERDVTLEIELLFAGDEALKADRLQLGQALRVSGFLAPKRKLSKSLVLHATRYELRTEPIIETN